MTDHWDVVWTPPDDEGPVRDWDYDIQEEIREAKRVRITIDGEELHDKLQRMLDQLSDREVTDLALSWLYLVPRLMDPFEMAYECTLCHVMQLPESTEIASAVASMTRFLLSLYCAAMEETAKRMERRIGGPGSESGEPS